MSTAITDFYLKLRGGNGVTLTNEEAERLYSVLLQQQESFAAMAAEAERLRSAALAMRAEVTKLAEDHGDGFEVVPVDLKVWRTFCESLGNEAEHLQS